ncbi:STAS/SEC14 domain-containing protein [Alteromonas aestuariivivens]|uniref:STAS/SEC14 domain-containing protein n=1 Tax=Alteromonas aestuariivivens TaxID=1938339 RepID=A0A3D8MDU1_9ALTE|nr:STAS/SEC14 domain-containing protein [Alteromonas aestuariivivens]RDV29007.1 STAS/SEC14 domain-containing protein [Alteromonas aestuariivivens]
MTFRRHGLTVGIHRIDTAFFVTFKAVGKLTHGDYQTITPMLDGALAEVQHPHVKMLVDVTEFEGWELRAAWDDFRLGLKHGRQMDKVAVVGNQRWQKTTASLASWFVAGEVRFFEDEIEALAWLNEDNPER